MAREKARVVSFLVREQFGDIVEKVSNYLTAKGPRSVANISESIKEDKNEVKKSLCVLIKHGLASYDLSSKPQTTFRILEDGILLRLRHPRFVYISKVKCGDLGELIVEELLANGYETISKIAKKVIQKQIQDDKGNQVNPMLSETIQKFLEMIQAHVLKRVKPPSWSLQEQGDEKDPNDPYLVPSNIIKELGRGKKKLTSAEETLNESMESAASTNEEDKYADDGIYWYVNFEKLHQYILDDLIVAAAGEKLDVAAGKIVETMLTKSGEQRDELIRATKTLASFEIVRKLPAVPCLTQDEVSQYLSLLADKKTGGFLQKVDETGGGMYFVNLHRCVELLCQTTLESIVQERFGSKALRIFRLLLVKKYLEQKQIGEMAMIPFKEAKDLLYKLLQENIVKLQEVSKGGDYAPSRAFYLFGVDMPHVARQMVTRSYQAVGNMMARREKEVTENKRLLDKNEMIEAVLATINASDDNTEKAQELEEFITPAEKEQLEKLKIDLTRIEHGEIQVDETLFILQQYLSFS